MPEEKSSTGAKVPVETRKPYVKPEFVSEPIYETMALACAKLPGQSLQCHRAPKRS